MTEHFDPIRLELIKNALESIVDEMALTVVRDEKISPQYAERFYGVAVDVKMMSVNRERTDKLRSQQRSGNE